MCLCEQWRLRCSCQWGWEVQLSEHVYCVAIAFKIIEPVKQQICTKFCVQLEYSSAETTPKIQKAAALGNWWLAASSWQHAHSCITSSAEFFSEKSNHPGNSAPLQPRFVTLWLLAFPKTKITFEREEISDHQWDSGKYDGQLVATGGTVWGPKAPTWKGMETSLLYAQCFLYPVSSINVSVFHIIWPCISWTDVI